MAILHFYYQTLQAYQAIQQHQQTAFIACITFLSSLYLRHKRPSDGPIFHNGNFSI